MKRCFIYVLTVFTLLIVPKEIVYASYCDVGISSDYKALAGNIDITYSYTMENGQPIFDVTISNLYEGMYIVDTLTEQKYTQKDFTSDNEIVIDGYRDGSKISYKIYVTVSGCYEQLLTTRYVTLPNYNEFSTDEVCKGAEEYSLCQRWGAVSIDHDTFVKEVEAYKERKNAKKDEIVFDDEKTFLEKILIFIGNYYIYLVLVVIIIVLILAGVKRMFAKKNQFDFKV